MEPVRFSPSSQKAWVNGACLSLANGGQTRHTNLERLELGIGKELIQEHCGRLVAAGKGIVGRAAANILTFYDCASSYLAQYAEYMRKNGVKLKNKRPVVGNEKRVWSSNCFDDN